MAISQLEVTTFGNNHTVIQVSKEPDECPVCHKGIKPIFRFGFLNNDSPLNADQKAQLIFSCPREECVNLFIADYTLSMVSFRAVRNTPFTLRSCRPKSFIQHSFPETIKKISCMFTEIYNQASEAETQGLDKVAGPGYRKALEFLIKDYLISQEKDDQQRESIKKMFLMNAIKNKVTDGRIKSCAQAAAWLGNDETHYLRIFTNADISVLKQLIHLTVNWIDSEVTTTQLLDSLSPTSTK